MNTIEKGISHQVDPASAEAFITEKHIGDRIKRLRLKKSMGLVELGHHTGLSPSFLSQLETGRVVPTLRNLARIAMVFGKDLCYFFEAEPHAVFRIHRKKERVRMPQTGVDDPTYYFESLAYMVPDRQLDPYYAEFVPLKKGVDVRPHVHLGFEFLYLLEGELEIRHSGSTHLLEPGDAVYFDAGTPHGYRCAGKCPAIAVIVTMHHQQHGSALSGGIPAMGATIAAKKTSPPPEQVKPVLSPRPAKESIQAPR
jgi:transcriptional regulator with XRE-family HTH domain